MVEVLLEFAQATGIFAFMHSAWGWPLVESIHFTGMCLLIAAVGLFDCRLLGMARAIPAGALHRLIPFGVAGFALNVASGFLFLVSAPDQYLYNPAFQIKMLLMVLAGFNMLLFYRTAVAEVRMVPEGALPTTGPRVMGAISLTCWSLVIICGRLITYYRPPYHWCFWC